MKPSLKALSSRFTGRHGYVLETDMWPDTAVVQLRRMRIGDGWAAVLLLVGYPASLPLGWLEYLVGNHARIETSIHINGLDPATAGSMLQRRRARFESQRMYAANRGKLDDPNIEAAAADAADFAGRIARGESQLHAQAVYVTVHALTTEALDIACARLRAGTAAAMLDLRPASARQLPGLFATLPLGSDPVGASRTVDTETAAASFPFCSADVPGPLSDDAVLLGLNLYTGAPVLWDRWSCPNHNSITVATSGAGKSYLTKTEILRQLYQGVRVTVVDPEAEYLALAGHVGSTPVRPGTPGVKLNPLAFGIDPAPDELGRRKLFCATVVETLLGERLGSGESAALQRATTAAYTAAGISNDPATWNKPAPGLDQVTSCLQADEDGKDLAARIEPYTGPGSMFASGGIGQRRPQGAEAHPMKVYDLSAVPAELSAVVTLVVLDEIWKSLRADGQRTLVVIDEAWLLLREGRAAAWLARMAKSARKRRAGLAVVTQDADDVTSTELGRVVINNSHTQILLRQAPNAVEAVAKAFRLTGAERELVATARRGEALLVAGEAHVLFKAVAPPEEHRLCRTGLSEDGDRS
jgi:hypothetical protein